MAKFASLGMAFLFLLAGFSQAMGNISCSMPCCGEKSDPCHASKERAIKMDACCGGTTTSLALGSGCGQERKEAVEFSTVCYSPTSPPHGVEVSTVEVPAIPSRGTISSVAATSPPGKAPLYLQNLILLI